MTAAAKQLGIAASTLLRWLGDGFVASEQITPGAPWRIRITNELRSMLVDNAPQAGSPSSTPPAPSASPAKPLLQRLKRGELQAVLTRTGRKKGLRIQLPQPQNTLF